ncbi:MAG: phosphodiester glycosidase family protein, partial [Nitrospinota bacterium]
MALAFLPREGWAGEAETPAPLSRKGCGRAIAIQERGEWQRLSPGLEYREMVLQAKGELSRVGVKLLRVEPEAIEVRVVHFESLGMSSSTVKELAERTGAVAAINGGFFGTDGRPLGFLVAAGRVINGRVRGRGKRKDLHYSAIFFIRGGKPFIVHRDFFSPSGVEHALQAGPHLIHLGKPTGGLDLYRENRRIA